MTLFIFAWITIGLFYVTMELHFLKNMNPRPMDFIVYELMKDAKESGTELDMEPNQIEFIITVFMTFAYIVAWPVILVYKNQ